MSEQRDALAARVMAALNEHGRSYRLPRDPSDLAYSVADAILATEPPPVADLDAAWAEVEAALPKGWVFELGRLDFDGEWDAFAKSRAFYEDDYRVPDREDQHIDAQGPTPAAALRALAARLSTPEPER